LEHLNSDEEPISHFTSDVNVKETINHLLSDVKFPLKVPCRQPFNGIPPIKDSSQGNSSIGRTQIFRGAIVGVRRRPSVRKSGSGEFPIDQNEGGQGRRISKKTGASVVTVIHMKRKEGCNGLGRT
jgi:hypothetical protein